MLCCMLCRAACRASGREDLRSPHIQHFDSLRVPAHRQWAALMATAHRAPARLLLLCSRKRLRSLRSVTANEQCCDCSLLPASKLLLYEALDLLWLDLSWRHGLHQAARTIEWVASVRSGRRKAGGGAKGTGLSTIAIGLQRRLSTEGGMFKQLPVSPQWKRAVAMLACPHGHATPPARARVAFRLPHTHALAPTCSAKRYSTTSPSAPCCFSAWMYLRGAAGQYNGDR